MTDLVELWRIEMAKHLDLKNAAAMLRETKNDVFAQICDAQTGSTNAEKERKARISDEWKEHRNAMLNAESEERKAHAAVVYRKMRFDEWRSLGANARAERSNY